MKANQGETTYFYPEKLLGRLVKGAVHMTTLSRLPIKGRTEIKKKRGGMVVRDKENRKQEKKFWMERVYFISCGYWIVTDDILFFVLAWSFWIVIYTLERFKGVMKLDQANFHLFEKIKNRLVKLYFSNKKIVFSEFKYTKLPTLYITQHGLYLKCFEY